MEPDPVQPDASSALPAAPPARVPLRPEDRRAIVDAPTPPPPPPPPPPELPPPPPASRPGTLERVSPRRRAAPSQAKVMSLGDHLDELRQRIIYALVGVGLLFFGSLYFGPTVLNWLIRPVQNALKAEGLPSALLATGMFETFFTYLKISTVVSIVLGFPWILWQAWRFVAPGLYRHERRFVTLLLPMSISLSVLSALFLYFFVLPVMLHFFVHFGATVSPQAVTIAEPPPGVSPLNIPVLDADPAQTRPGDLWFNRDLKELRLTLEEGGKTVTYSTQMATSTGIVLQPRVREWVDTLLSLALAFAAGFQLPVVVLLLGWVGLVTPAFLGMYRRHALFAIAVIAALLTPPDPISMLIMMAPLYLLYEFAIVVLRLFPAERVGRVRDEREGDDHDPDDPDHPFDPFDDRPAGSRREGNGEPSVA